MQLVCRCTPKRLGITLMGYAPDFLLFLTLIFLSHQPGKAFDARRPSAASEAPVLAASQALSHTERLLYPFSGNTRRLETVPGQHEDGWEVRQPLGVCSQSKYLCQVHTLHSPKAPRPATFPKAKPKGSKAAVGVRQHFAIRRLSATFGGRRLSARKPASQRVAAAASTKGEKAPLTDSRGFKRVPQGSRYSGVFLPIRIQTAFHDFQHPLERCQSNPVGFKQQEAAALQQQSAAPGEKPSDEGMSGSDWLAACEDARREEPGRQALHFSRVRRFWQLDAVPAALWWLQRVVTLNRREGPLILETDKEEIDKQGEEKAGRCGLCSLPWLPKVQSQEGNASLGQLKDADVLLLFRTVNIQAENGSQVCQVDEAFRPIAVCISVFLEEAERIYEDRNLSFPSVITSVLAYITNAFAVNTQVLPHYLTWEPTWRRQALQRLAAWPASGQPPARAVRRLAVAGRTSAAALAANAEEDAKPAEEKSQQDGRYRLFLSTPQVVKAARRRFGCRGDLGLELQKENPTSPNLLKSLYPPRQPEAAMRAHNPRERFLTDLMLAAIEDSGWYRTEGVWAGEPEGAHADLHDDEGCGFPTGAFRFAAEPLDVPNAGSGSLAAGGGTAGEERETEIDFERQDAALERDHNKVEYPLCSKSTVGLFAASARPAPPTCYRILCISDDDRVEAPMMLPTAKPVKWIAAQITRRLADGSQQSLVCLRGEKGQQKKKPHRADEVLECPDVDAVCLGRPCKHGGVPKHGVCICMPGTFGRNCEFWDSERNRLRYPNRFSYGENSSITLATGNFFAIPAFVEGPQNLYFRPISTLPAGLTIDARTGAIFGTPKETTKGHCIPLALEVQMEEAPHAAERTILSIRVAGNFPDEENKATASSRDETSHDLHPSNFSPNSTKQERENSFDRKNASDWIAAHMHIPADCEHFVKGDMRRMQQKHDNGNGDES